MTAITLKAIAVPNFAIFLITTFWTTKSFGPASLKNKALAIAVHLHTEP